MESWPAPDPVGIQIQIIYQEEEDSHLQLAQRFNLLDAHIIDHPKSWAEVSARAGPKL
jgi:hypothetical protein